MAKISVRHSVAQAYGLLFGRPLTVIGLTWLPALFYAEGASFLIHKINAALVLAVPSSNGLLGPYAFFYFAALVAATALFGATIAVPLTRQAFGLRDETVAVHLVIGGREFRLWLALLRYYAIVVSLVVVLAVCAGVAVSQGTHLAVAQGIGAQWLGMPLETWFNSVAGAIAVIVFTVFAVRYGFLLDAVSSVEEHAKLRRASALSRGNFWPIAAILFVVAVPAGLFVVACEMTFGGFVIAGQSFAPADAASFAAILTIGLVVLHTLAAGASAGAYSEMAEAAAQEAQPEEAPVYMHEPRAVFAQQDSAPVHGRSFTADALAVPAGMEVATLEAQNAAAVPNEPAAPNAFPGQWMAPPRDAHFGSDPHDAQTHETQTAEVQAADVAGEQSLQPAAADIAHAVEAQNAAPADAVNEAVVAEAEPVPVHPDVADAATEAAAAENPEIPDHAQTAEFPSPPLDPTGAIASAMQAHAGFHNPG